MKCFKFRSKSEERKKVYDWYFVKTRKLTKDPHIPHPPHISTLPTCFPENPLLERISKISWRRTRKGAWERCRETFREMWWCLAGDHSLYRSPETSLLAAKSHKQGKSWLRPTAITTHLLRRLLGQTLGGNVWSFSISKIWFHELCETLESIFWWIWFNLVGWFHKKLEREAPFSSITNLPSPFPGCTGPGFSQNIYINSFTRSVLIKLLPLFVSCVDALAI